MTTHNDAFRELVKKMNHMVNDLTKSMDYLFTLRQGGNVAVLTIGERSFTVTPQNAMDTYRKLQRLQVQFEGGPMIASFILDLLKNP